MPGTIENVALASVAPARPAGKLQRSLLGGLVTALPVLAIGLLILNFAPNYYTFLALGAFVNLIVVVGLQVFMGNSNIANLGHSAFVGVGAYGVAILATPMAMKKRQDVVTDGSKADDIVANAPATEEDFFLVPKVVE